MIIKNIWQNIRLVCEKHGTPLNPTPSGSSLRYECELKNKKEMCKVSIDTNTFEKLLTRLCEEVDKKEQAEIFGPLGKVVFKIGYYTFTLIEEKDDIYTFAVSDKRLG